MPDYPPGYDPSQAASISAEDQAIGGLISLAALAAVVGGAVAYGVFVSTGGPIAGDAVTAALSQVITGTEAGGAAVMECEEMIAAQLIEKGSIEEASAYITRMAYQRAIDALMSEEAAITAAEAEAAAAMLVIGASIATVNAAIVLTAARVQEQQALSQFFTSGMGHF